MEQFETEEQQVEAIKRFWKENGIAIVIGAVLGLGGLWGWRYYDESQITAKESASEAYQEMLVGLSADSTVADLEPFIQANPGKTYTTLASLIAAQTAANQDDLAKAADLLSGAAANESDSALKDLVNIRLARAYYGLGENDQALATLANITTDAFVSAKEALRGDVLVAQQDFAGATAAYQASLEAKDDANVKMRLDDVALQAANAG